MRIAFATPIDLRALASWFQQPPETLPTGMGSTAVTPLVAAFLKRGHSVVLFTLSRDVAEETVIRGPSLTAFVGPCRESGRARDLWRAEVDFLRVVIEREHPDFVHAHWTYEFALGALRSKRPTLVTIHDLPWNVLRYFRDPYRAARTLLAYRVAARATRYSAVSSDAARHFRRYFRPGAAIAVVPNFLDDQVFAIGSTRPVAPHPFTFCTVLQGFTARKNAKAALAAFAMVRRRNESARLLMLGEGFDDVGAASSWARTHGLAEGVTFRGALPYAEMLETLHTQADVLVHPSLDESFSMAALEAMALRKPVIAGVKTPGVRQVLAFGDCGLLVDVRRPPAIAAAMEKLAADIDLREALAARAWDSAYARFRPDPVLDAYERIYQELLADGEKTYAAKSLTRSRLSRKDGTR